MYPTLLFIHSLFRWVVFALLLVAICEAYIGWCRGRKFSQLDNVLRHWTATASHLQLVGGIILYTQSPIVKYFWNNFNEGSPDLDTLFFGFIHIALMFTAIMAITIGSALAKRKQRDEEKFKTVCIWFAVSFLIILIAIPWPFSPIANRPFFR